MLLTEVALATQIVGVAVVLVVGLLAVGIVGFLAVFRKQALEPKHTEPAPDLVVVSRDGDSVTLSATTTTLRPDWTEGESWGLTWDGGYGALGKVLAQDRKARTVTRKFTAVVGECPPGTAARIDSFAFHGDPQQAHELTFQEVEFSSSLGTFGAWLVPADGTKWAVFVHGRNADRREGLRILPSLHDANVNVLMIDYRNDSGCPPDPTRQHRYGLSEWDEVAAAVEFAKDAGAESIVLVGNSMGAALALQFMQRSARASHVAGLILDSPMLDLPSTALHQITNGRVPRWLTGPLWFLVHRRFGLNVGALNVLSRSGELSTPMLVIHGTKDTDIPCSLSEDLASARPDLVTFERFEGAAHVRSWNTDRRRYEAAVSTFLMSLGRDQDI